MELLRVTNDERREMMGNMRREKNTLKGFLQNDLRLNWHHWAHKDPQESLQSKRKNQEEMALNLFVSEAAQMSEEYFFIAIFYLLYFHTQRVLRWFVTLFIFYLCQITWKVFDDTAWHLYDAEPLKMPDVIMSDDNSRGSCLQMKKF